MIFQKKNGLVGRALTHYAKQQPMITAAQKEKPWNFRLIFSASQWLSLRRHQFRGTLLRRPTLMQFDCEKVSLMEHSAPVPN